MSHQQNPWPAQLPSIATAVGNSTTRPAAPAPTSHQIMRPHFCPTRPLPPPMNSGSNLSWTQSQAQQHPRPTLKPTPVSTSIREPPVTLTKRDEIRLLQIMDARRPTYGLGANDCAWWAKVQTDLARYLGDGRTYTSAKRRMLAMKHTYQDQLRMIESGYVPGKEQREWDQAAKTWFEWLKEHDDEAARKAKADDERWRANKELVVANDAKPLNLGIKREPYEGYNLMVERRARERPPLSDDDDDDEYYTLDFDSAENGGRSRKRRRLSLIEDEDEDDDDSSVSEENDSRLTEMLQMLTSTITKISQPDPYIVLMEERLERLEKHLEKIDELFEKINKHPQSVFKGATELLEKMQREESQGCTK